MEEERPHEVFESGLDHRLPPAERRTKAAHRRIFRQMVKQEIENRPLNWLRRRALIRFAEKKLRMDAFEARLIIRGVEYECGHVAPAAMANVESPVATEYLPKKEHEQYWLTRALVFPVALVVICLILWLLRQ
ncbi:MAG: hypothetical protein MI923_12440 [Phycisphaerales bacterium]|nr:hypothetical protein [Phycisphaerales bacterium]